MTKYINIPFISVIFISFLVTSCGAVRDSREALFESDSSAVELRSYQSRVFDTTDKKKVVKTVIATMQDLGFVIGDADLEIGVVSGSKYADEHSAQMTVTVRVRNATQTLVRANVQQHLESVEYPAIYQDFYVALGKAMFLTAHNVD